MSPYTVTDNLIAGLHNHCMTEIAEQSQEPFTPQGPKREWLLRCQQTERGDRLATCSVLAEAGRIVIVDADDVPTFALDGSQIGEFRDAFLAATAVVDQDIRERRVPIMAD